MTGNYVTVEKRNTQSQKESAAVSKLERRQAFSRL
jgi:hypothetical protein